MIWLCNEFIAGCQPSGQNCPAISTGRFDFSGCCNGRACVGNKCEHQAAYCEGGLPKASTVPLCTHSNKHCSRLTPQNVTPPVQCCACKIHALPAAGCDPLGAACEDAATCCSDACEVPTLQGRSGKQCECATLLSVSRLQQHLG